MADSTCRVENALPRSIFVVVFADNTSETLAFPGPKWYLTCEWKRRTFTGGMMTALGSYPPREVRIQTKGDSTMLFREIKR